MLLIVNAKSLAMETVIKKSLVPIWKDLLDELQAQLDVIEKSGDNTITKAQNAVQLCRDMLKKLEDLVEDYHYKDQQEEIYFFREVKPKFLSRLIYYQRLFNIELARPVGNEKDQQAYLQKELERIKEFFDDNKFFYQYFRSSETYLDEKLFLRNADTNTLALAVSDINANPSFTTHFDYILSRILANEMLLGYLNKAIAETNEPVLEAKEKARAAKALQWTEAKSALIELIYAFKARGSFNNGKATLKEITDYLQLVFNVEITNPSRDFQDILSRKRSPTIYLDGLKDSYLKYIDAIDNK